MGYKIHHLNCATLCIPGGRFFTGKGSPFTKAKLSCHCLLIETDDGLVLVDTGFAVKDIREPRFPETYFLKYVLGARMDEEECALTQIRALGYSEADVRHIVLTHLDPDHAGGIMDFPNATVHVLAKELQAAMEPTTLWDKARYLRYQWAHNPNWQAHTVKGESWYGFESVQILSNKLFDILLIPLLGHSRGHCGVAVSTDSGWILHCGDAYFNRTEITASKWPPPGILLTEALIDAKIEERIYNQRRLSELYKQFGREIKLFCSHDHSEYDCCNGHRLQLGKWSA